MAIEAALRAAVGEDAVSTLEVDRWAYARDLSVRGIIRARGGQAFARPLAVVWPADVEPLQRLIALARRERLELVPFGSGSGVVGGLEAGARTVVVDLKRIDGLALDPAAATCVAGAGVIGEQLERWLNARGFSLGHFPSSIYCSTVGGWVATRSAGQLSSRYGKIEDLVRWVEGVDGQGRVWRLQRGDRDLDALGLAVGSEGALLVITRVGLEVHRLPSHRALRGADFPTVVQALDAMRAMMRGGLAPAVLRLYDPLDALLSGHAGGEADADASGVEAGAIGQAGLEQIRAPGLPGADAAASRRGLLGRLASLLDVEDQAAGASRAALRRAAVLGSGAWPRLGALLAGQARRCRLVFGFEGSEGEVAAAEAAARQLVEHAAGHDLGPGPGRHWLQRRYAVSYRMSRVLDAGLWVDTFEVAARWSRLYDVYRAVRRAVQGHALCLAHFSHAYADGCSIYFTFVGGGDGVDEAVALHAATWRAGLLAARDSGAVLSHHHGIGRLKAEALAGVEGPGSELLRRSLKRALDPDEVLNPGVLGLAAAPPDPAMPAPAMIAPALAGLRPVAGFELDVSSGLVRVDPGTRLAELALQLGRVGFELGARPAAFGELTVAAALRQQDPRLLARLTSIEARVQDQPLAAPLAPRSATGPDLKSFVLGEAAPPVVVDRTWLVVRELVAPTLRRFAAPDPGRAADAARELVGLGATAVELHLDATQWFVDLWHPAAPAVQALWQARAQEVAQRLGAPLPAADRWDDTVGAWPGPQLALHDVDLAALLRALAARGGPVHLQLAPRGGLVLAGIDASALPAGLQRRTSGWAALLAEALATGGQA